MCFFRSFVATAFFLTTTSLACATQLIKNGDFESGNLNWWKVTDQGDGSWYAASGTTTPVSGNTTVGAAKDISYAVTDQVGPGAHALIQSFIVAPASSVILSFDMFINNRAGRLINDGNVLDPYNADFPINQFGTVDILSAGASPFDTTAGEVTNLFIGLDTDGINPFVHYDYDITDIVRAGGKFQLRFAEVDTEGYFNMGIDNVSITTDAPVPEPGTMMLLGAGFLGLAGFGKFRRKG